MRIISDTPRIVHAGILVDESHAPLLLMRVGNRVNVDDMNRYTSDLDRVLASKKPFTAMVLVRERGELDRRVVGIYGEWTRRNLAAIEQYWLGAAFVFPNEMLRFLLSAILLAAPTATPHQVFSKTDAALRWCDSRLALAGLNAPRLDDATLWGALVR